MNKEQIIEQVVTSGIVPRYVCKLTRSSYRDDIVSELYLYICELPADRLTTLYGCGGMGAVYSYISGLLIHQLRSANSKVYKKYILHANTNCVWEADGKIHA